MNSLEKKKSANKKRIDRFALQDVARLVLGEKSRVATCGRVAMPRMQEGIDGKFRMTGDMKKRGISIGSEGTAHYHGVGACGDVWTCPVCSAKISEGRRREVLYALKENRARGGCAIMVNFTFSHQHNEKLKPMLDNFLKTTSRMKASRTYKNIREGIKQFGSIRALEVTHGENGFHPHIHEIWFLKQVPTKEHLKQIENELFALWFDYCKKYNLGLPNKTHGVKVCYKQGDGSDAVGSYLTKWGNELTGAMKKDLSKKSGVSMWGLLRRMLAQKKERMKNLSKYSKIIAHHAHYWDARDAKIFKEYAKCFAGKRQLFWSNGLKNEFQIHEISDNEISERQEKIFIRDLSSDEWTAIMWSGMRASVLQVAESMPLFLDDYIDRIKRSHCDWRLHHKKNKVYVAKYDFSFKHYSKKQGVTIEFNDSAVA